MYLYFVGGQSGGTWEKLGGDAMGAWGASKISQSGLAEAPALHHPRSGLIYPLPFFSPSPRPHRAPSRPRHPRKHDTQGPRPLPAHPRA